MNDKGLKYVEYALYVSLAASLLFKFALLLNLKIGWDEFFFLSKIYDFQRGDLTGSFQNFHVHLFQWLPLVSTNEVMQIFWARGILFLLFLGSCHYFYLIGRHFFPRPAVLFALLCYLSLSNIIVHAATYRYDSIGSYLFLAAFYHLLKAPFRSLNVLLAGALMALSLVLSIKASFHVVTLLCLLGILSLEQFKPTAAFKAFGLFLAVLAGLFFILLRFHSWTLPKQVKSAATSTNFLSAVFDKVISIDNAYLGLYYFADSYIQNILIWVIFLLGIYLTVRACVTEKSDRRPLLSLVTLIPFATLLIYRNAFPYYYVFIVAPGFILCGVVVNNLLEDYRQNKSRGPLAVVHLLILAVLAWASVHYVASFRWPADSQKRLIREVHRIFPKPVPYIDGCSAVASYPKVGLFMSTWGMQSYLAKGKPIMRDLIAGHQPKFLLADIPSLDLSLPRENHFTEHNFALIPEDWQTLRDNFVHYWNIIYVPGKELDFSSPPYTRRFEILISGTYTLEGDTPIVIDEQVYKPGEALFLNQGIHEGVASKPADTVRLRWGKNLYRPTVQMQKPAFYGFRVVSF